MTSWQAGSAREILRVRPFRGVRYTPRAGALEAVTFTPPTSWSRVREDLLSRVGQHHVLQLLAPAFSGDAGTGAQEVRDRLASWFESGVVRRDPDPALYVYERSDGERPVVGIVGTVDLLTDNGPAFLDHEEVIDSLVAAQEALERTTAAQVEPILALHRGATALDPLLRKVMSGSPISGVTDDAGVSHRLWRVWEPDLQERIAEAIPDRPMLIADGHHRHSAWLRAASAPADRPENAALTLITDASQPGLRLGAVHRVIDGLDLERVTASGAVRWRRLDGRADAAAYLREGPPARCVLYAGHCYYAVTPAEQSAVCTTPELAVCHLHSHWLDRWGVAETEVGYVHQVDEAVSIADTGQLAVLLPATGVDEVFAAAEDDRPLPRKATSFGPKPLVGMVFRTWAPS